MTKTVESTSNKSLSWALGSLDMQPVAPPTTPAHRNVHQSSPAMTQLDGDNGVDWQLVVELRREASAELSSRLESWEQSHVGARLDADDRRLMGRAVIGQIVRAHAERLSATGQKLWSLQTEKAYSVAVEDAIFGFGRLQPLFEIPDAENIEINGHDCVNIQYGDGRRQPHHRVADSDEELIEAIRFIGANANPPRPFDDAHPMMTVALGDRFRLHALGFGLSHRPSIVIRQHILTEVGLADLAASGMFDMRVAEFLRCAVLARKSIVISGDQGAGKTTLLRALIDAIPSGERFGTLETDYELLTHLQPNRRNILALQAKSGMGEIQDGRRLGNYSIADLIPEALRQNLSRLIVGEVRGAEAATMFEAMQSGAGTMSTTHSHSAESTMDRLAARVAMDGTLSVAEAFRQIALNLHLLIHVSLVDDTWRGGLRRRFISEIRWLTGAVECDRPVTHLVYRAAGEGRPYVWDPPAALLAELRPFEQKSGQRG